MEPGESPCLAIHRETFRRLAQLAFALVVLLASATAKGGDANPSGFLPEAVVEENFAELKTRSPFLRSLGVSDSVVLTGVARIEEEIYVSLFDTATDETHFVSRIANPLGWQLVEIRGKESDLETLAAKIQVSGGEVVSIRYEKLSPKNARGTVGGSSPGSSGPASPSRLSSSQLAEAKKAAVNFREGYSADGYPKEPPPDVVQKLSRLSVDQREAINREMIGLRNEGLGMEDRRRIYRERIDRAIQGR